ncbi:MAG: hypothetical protein IPN15_10550 [Saprospiraceae bacterium]|nr:hypothetical protein [Candidatus Vicinibacter affinis]
MLETILEEYDKQKGIWSDNYNIFEKKHGFLDKGMKAAVYVDKYSEHHLIKTFGYYIQSQKSPLDLLDKIALIIICSHIPNMSLKDLQ